MSMKEERLEQPIIDIHPEDITIAVEPFEEVEAVETIKPIEATFIMATPKENHLDEWAFELKEPEAPHEPMTYMQSMSKGDKEVNNPLESYQSKIENEDTKQINDALEETTEKRDTANERTSFQSFKRKQYKREQEWVQDKRIRLKKGMRGLARVGIKLPILYSLKMLVFMTFGACMIAGVAVVAAATIMLGVAAFLGTSGVPVLGEMVVYIGIGLLGSGGLVLLLMTKVYQKVMTYLSRKIRSNRTQEVSEDVGA